VTSGGRRESVGPLSLRPRIATAPVQKRTHAGGGQPSRLELSRELRDDAPFLSGRRASEGDRECVLDGQGTGCRVHFVWPNHDLFTRTYVNSRRVILT
jgi:hypothetical protein